MPIQKPLRSQRLPPFAPRIARPCSPRTAADARRLPPRCITLYKKALPEEGWACLCWRASRAAPRVDALRPRPPPAVVYATIRSRVASFDLPGSSPASRRPRNERLRRAVYTVAALHRAHGSHADSTTILVARRSSRRLERGEDSVGLGAAARVAHLVASPIARELLGGQRGLTRRRTRVKLEPAAGRRAAARRLGVGQKKPCVAA